MILRPAISVAGSLIVAIFCGGLAAEEPALEPSGPPRAEARPNSTQIERWVRELDADEFGKREVATESLVDGGPDAVAPVAGAVLSGRSLEVTVRGVFVLREMALGGDFDTEVSARESLEQIADSTLSSAARRAAAALAALDKLRQDKALAQLAELGAVVKRGSVQLGITTVSTANEIVFDEKFKGTDRDLIRLKWLPEVQKISFEGKRFGDESLRHIGKVTSLRHLIIKRTKVTAAALKGLRPLENLTYIDLYYSPIDDDAIDHLKTQRRAQWIKLYGTGVSKGGAQKLQDALAGVNVDVRQGAFLGVGCTEHELGCLVNILHPDSAAQHAGIRPGDVIAKYNGKKVPNFEALTEMIGSHVAGDTVNLEILRGGETLDKKIKLGEWD